LLPGRSARFLSYDFLASRFTDIFVGSVKLSGICKKITISKLFNFFQEKSLIVRISSSLGLLIGLYTVRILEVSCKYSFGRFRFTVLFFISSLKLTILDLTVICRSGI
jgi:hypothetical protein